MNNIKTTTNNKRIAKNTLLLYCRMLFSLFVSLYTSRIILNSLGVENFGIYNVVGGVVTMFSFLNATLAGASQRFIAFEIGKGDESSLVRTFKTTQFLHLSLAFILFVLIESIGLWFLNTKMNIDSTRMVAANWVFQCSTLSLLVAIISVPYNATIIAHEKMSAFAFIGIFEVLTKLGVACAVSFSPYDRLIVYAILILFIQVSIRMIYGVYCRNKFIECKNSSLSFDKKIIKEMTSYVGWNTIGAIAYVAREQGVNIVINLFCGTAINAARAISSQVTNALYGFISNFQTAINPQITKQYASGNISSMILLIYRGSKFSTFLFYFLALPIFYYTPYILKLWLTIVPDSTVTFIRLSIVLMMLECLASPLITALLAIGRVKYYQIIAGVLLLLNLPLSYYFLRLGYSPYITVIIAIILSALTIIVRLVLLRLYSGFSLSRYMVEVIARIFGVIITAAIVPTLIYIYQSDESFLNLIFLVAICWLSTIISIYCVGLSVKDKFIISKLIIDKLKYRKK